MVLPQFVPLFAQNNAALPPSTQFMIDAGAFLGDYGLYLLLALALLGPGRPSRHCVGRAQGG